MVLFWYLSIFPILDILCFALSWYCSLLPNRVICSFSALLISNHLSMNTHSGRCWSFEPRLHKTLTTRMDSKTAYFGLLNKDPILGPWAQFELTNHGAVQLWRRQEWQYWASGTEGSSWNAMRQTSSLLMPFSWIWSCSKFDSTHDASKHYFAALEHSRVLRTVWIKLLWVDPNGDRNYLAVFRPSLCLRSCIRSSFVSTESC